MKKVLYKWFSCSLLKSMDSALAEAAEFATEIGEERLITISNGNTQSVVVWYWSE